MDHRPSQRERKFSRRYLPHFDRPGLVQAVTFRLADSLPACVLESWSREFKTLPKPRRALEKRQRIAAWLDQGSGACLLREPRIAALVEETLLHFHGQRYRLLAWCIMPNHVHVMVETSVGHPLPQVVHSWKTYSAREANRLLAREGPFWMRDYFDRFIRNVEHLQAARAYIEANPVKARLVEVPEKWRWSSAWEGRVGDEL